MRITTEKSLYSLYNRGRNFRRAAWPEGDRISSDGAEGGRFWYYKAATDDLIPDWKFDFNDLVAEDWEFAH